MKKGMGSVLCLALGFGIGSLLSGCVTCKNMADGTSSTTKEVLRSPQKDMAALWQSIKKSDSWMRDNLW